MKICVPKFRQNLTIPKRHAYTLLELMLSLALSVMVIGAITALINVYMVNLSRQQRSIEQKQVARSVLRMIASDVRAGLQYKAVDVSGIENLEASQTLIAGILATQSDDSGLTDTGSSTGGGTGGTGGGTGGTGGGTGGTGGGTGGTGATPTDAQDPNAADTDATAEEDNSSYRPTMIGDATVINIDISRLPRLDQYHAMLTGDDVSSMTGADVKGVSYMVSSSPAPNAQSEFEPSVANLGGLYRRQIDRAVAEFRGEGLAPSSPDEYSQLVAPEVIEIRFQYFDGSDWTSSWNSEETGYFPLAIEITLILDPQRVDDAVRQQPRSLSVKDILQMQTYRTVVHLPSAEKPPETSE